MREKSRYQKNVETALEHLRADSADMTLQKEGELLWMKYTTTGQEPVKMAAALRGYFLQEALPEARRRELEHYLRAHLRNAIETLIEEEEPEKIGQLEEQGWFREKELEDFIRIARERQRIQSMIWLMSLKDRKYGYQEEKFDL